MTEVIWLLLLVPFAASLGAQKLVRSTYRRYRAVANHAGLAGAEIARARLDAHGLQRGCIVWLPLVLGAEELRKPVVRRRTA